MRPVDDAHAHHVGIGESVAERQREAHRHAHPDTHAHNQPQPVGQRVIEWLGVGQRQPNLVPLSNAHANSQSCHHHAQPHAPLIA